MATKLLQAVEIDLPVLVPTIEFTGILWLVAAPGDQRLLEGEKLPDRNEHQFDQLIKHACPLTSQFDLLVDQRRPDLLQGAQRLIDAAITAFAMAENAAILQSDEKFIGQLRLAGAWMREDGDERQGDLHG